MPADLPGPYSVTCPACDSAPGEPCWYLRPPYEPCQHPHRARVKISRRPADEPRRATEPELALLAELEAGAQSLRTVAAGLGWRRKPTAETLAVCLGFGWLDLAEGPIYRLTLRGRAVLACGADLVPTTQKGT